MTRYDAVPYSKSEGIATVMLNRPSKANTLRSRVILDLAKAKYDALTGEWISGKAAAAAGLQATQMLGPILDGIVRNTPEGGALVRDAASEGVEAAIARRDGPFEDDSQGAPEEEPRKRRELP